MPITILQSLTRPNPKVYRYATSGGLTFNNSWAAVEGVRPWEDFTYDILTNKFKAELKKTVPSWDPNDLIKRARLSETVLEDSVTAFLTVNCILPVNNALWEVDDQLYVGAGSKFAKRVGAGSPDWGCGRAHQNITDRDNLCPGDFKCSSKWISNGLLDVDWSVSYEDTDLSNQVKPLEQVQHYCTHHGTRYGWIMTDNELVVIRVTNSIDDEYSSPRQTRSSASGVVAAPTHQRVVSNTSNLSSAFSAMSIDHSAYSGGTGSSSGNNPAPLEIVCIPMSASIKHAKDGKTGAKGQLTVNLALFFLALLARENCVISSSYPALDSAAPKTGAQTASKSSTKSSAKLDTKPSTKPSTKASKSHQSHTSTAQPQSKFFIPAGGIQRAVIETDIELYLPGASVKLAQNNGVDGYLISTEARKEDLPSMVSCLKADTLSWAREGGLYADSETYLTRRRLLQEEEYDDGDNGDDGDDDIYEDDSMGK